MKITKTQLKQIIKEELGKVVREGTTLLVTVANSAKRLENLSIYLKRLNL
jgi:hypothetical protein